MFAFFFLCFLSFYYSRLSCFFPWLVGRSEASFFTPISPRAREAHVVAPILHTRQRSATMADELKVRAGRHSFKPCPSRAVGTGEITNRHTAGHGSALGHLLHNTQKGADEGASVRLPIVVVFASLFHLAAEHLASVSCSSHPSSSRGDVRRGE